MALITRKRVELLLGWVSLIMAFIGWVEKARHYYALARKTYRKRTTPGFGFAPESKKRKR